MVEMEGDENFAFLPVDHLVLLNYSTVTRFQCDPGHLMCHSEVLLCICHIMPSFKIVFKAVTTQHKSYTLMLTLF